MIFQKWSPGNEDLRYLYFRVVYKNAKDNPRKIESQDVFGYEEQEKSKTLDIDFM